MREMKVVPYKQEWKNQYEVEKQLIEEVFQDEIVDIHHIGSTSVPGLAAKPVIDILIEVKNIAFIHTYNNEMIKRGYECKGENGIEGRRYFQKGGEDRTHHVHMYEQGHSEVGRHLRFRDYLRKHPDEAWQYACLKQELAKKYQYSPAEYVEGKTSFIQMIDQKALRK
ncbi:GrpB family protein [Priestia flexa]|uniref:GrpB family protein n=1 Tax=Priestia flexa TaxID=86664 RepID=UPI001B336CB3|nr:GrpB family protein [Priestia flexa]